MKVEVRYIENLLVVAHDMERKAEELQQQAKQVRAVAAKKIVHALMNPEQYEEYNPQLER